VDAALGRDAKELCKMSQQELAVTVEAHRERLRSQYFSLPASESLYALFAVCGPHRLQLILNRHLSPEHAGLSGVPDLFVYAIDLAQGKPTIARFVEVKKPEEPASRAQLDEIDFLNRLGLHARVLRLKER